MPRVRRPTHAGSWYEDQGQVLSSQIQNWIETADPGHDIHARAVIAPHAGYRYSGHVMAYAYKCIQPHRVKRVFLLGPSHHFYSKQCLLSPHDVYSTPVGSVPIDKDIYTDLLATGKFEQMNADVDEAEHSLELHMPYIVEVMKGQDFTLIPIVVGAVSSSSEASYGMLLAPYLDDPDNLFIISSDFCHWGSRFNYTYYKKSAGEIHESIEELDRMGMELIEAGDPLEFKKYLDEYGNTICGRHPISTFLHAMQHCETKHNIKFTRYDQSSRCIHPRDSSVSYAAAIISTTTN